MNKNFLIVGVIFGLWPGAGIGQETAKPLSEAQFLQIDGLGTGDPLRKEPLGIGEEMLPVKVEKTEKPAKKEKGPTEITALEAAFDNKAHQAVFTGQVVVIDPEFNVNCDKLTAFFKHAGEKSAPESTEKATPKPGPKSTPVSPSATPAPAKPSKEKSGAGGLSKAIAEGDGTNRVTITQEKQDTSGSVNRNVGHGRKAVYEATTGDITLTGSPTVQQGFNTCVATDESTVMILNREGRMRVIGPHKTVIKDTSAESSTSNR